MSTDPTIAHITAEESGDPFWHEDTMDRGQRRMESIPVRYRDAVVDVPQVAAWVRHLVDLARTDGRLIPQITTGPSLLVLGGTGTGKTYQAYGAVRALSVCGAKCAWVVTTAADFYAKLRPRHGVDSEAEFERYADAALLVLDDLGAAKGTEWNEEINYRLINHRYEHELPTLITSNVPPPELKNVLGERVASRLTEMADRVALKGVDRRRLSVGAA